MQKFLLSPLWERVVNAPPTRPCFQVSHGLE
jgi:hypothetical protein